MKNRKNRMPKKEYFQMRMENAIANGLVEKAQYYAGRLAQMNEHSDRVTIERGKVLNASSDRVTFERGRIIR